MLVMAATLCPSTSAGFHPSRYLKVFEVKSKAHLFFSAFSVFSSFTNFIWHPDKPQI
jgi:hypothetical protein